jgi:hypothetical protein
MSWEQVGQRRYYYRHKKVGGVPHRVYLGAAHSPAAELAAAADDLRRLQREVQARERKAEQDHLRQAETPLLELCLGTEQLARAALLAGGFHQHDRGLWRIRREPNTPARG